MSYPVSQAGERGIGQLSGVPGRLDGARDPAVSGVQPRDARRWPQCGHRDSIQRSRHQGADAVV
jgi:hypothetical protein